ncbi:unnamed protein product [Didymodactylos carnosus]|uniref:Uncharacterized protein n=2 Tax=Didymodactylos carnosus TaxID=1234261 RepID=A0A8S2J533_9BILA|nr:unnamed protein product [Didymodactylos carnosus]CAF3783612.1 unnamed protein product [Didymodactylos carnosus]
MSYWQRNSIQDVRRYGTTVNVPNNDVAKCMYYLNCVCNVIEYDDDNIQRYKNYENWRNLSDYEDYLVFILCLTLSPDEFEDRVFFQDDDLCGDSANQFYEIGQVRHHLVAAQSIVIAGQTRHVNRIMAYKQSWMNNNYTQPMLNLARRFSPQQQQSLQCVIS